MANTFGQTSFAGARSSAPGGGGGVTGANSGLHLNGAIAQLGNVGTPLLANTNINLAGFVFDINTAAKKLLNLNPLTFFYQLGDIDGLQNFSNIAIDDTNQQLTFYSGSGGSVFFNASFGSGLYQLGDINNIANNSFLQINDGAQVLNFFANGNTYLSLDAANQQFEIGNLTGGNFTEVVVFDTAQLVQIRSNAALDPFLSLNILNDNYAIGDINGVAGAMFLLINGATQQTSVFSGANKYLLIDVANQLYQLGDINNSNNQTLIEVDDSLQRVEIYNSTKEGLFIDFANGLYQIGDILGTGNSTVISVNDATQLINLLATNIQLTIDSPNGLIKLFSANGVQTSDPNGAGTAGSWKLGKVIAAASVLDATQYVEVNIGGAVVKLAMIT